MFISANKLYHTDSGFQGCSINSMLSTTWKANIFQHVPVFRFHQKEQKNAED